MAKTPGQSNQYRGEGFSRKTSGSWKLRAATVKRGYSSEIGVTTALPVATSEGATSSHNSAWRKLQGSYHDSLIPQARTDPPTREQSHNPPKSKIAQVNLRKLQDAFNPESIPAPKKAGVNSRSQP